MICCDSCHYTSVEGVQNAIHLCTVFRRHLPVSHPVFPARSHLSAHAPLLLTTIFFSLYPHICHLPKMLNLYSGCMIGTFKTVFIPNRFIEN